MKKHLTRNLLLIFTLPLILPLKAQTDVDGLMMAKRNICGGPMYTYSSWKNYWEGTNHRNNANLGTVSSQMIGAMAIYGITDKINIMASLPWISNKPSAGTFIGQKGFQDLSLLVKTQFWEKKVKDFDISTLAIAGVSTPVSDYVADYLPFAIGLHSRNAWLRLMADVQKGHWYATASGAYMVRSNVTIDRDAYYTTELIYSSEVAMPDVWMSNIRLGWRKGADLVIEGVLDRMNTLGGFDMRKNEMPFLSNNMEATRAGINFKLPIPGVGGLSVVGASMYTLAGRNMGQSFSNMVGIMYQTEFKKKEAAK